MAESSEAFLLPDAPKEGVTVRIGGDEVRIRAYEAGDDAAIVAIFV